MEKDVKDLLDRHREDTANLFPASGRIPAGLRAGGTWHGLCLNGVIRGCRLKESGGAGPLRRRPSWPRNWEGERRCAAS